MKKIILTALSLSVFFSFAQTKITDQQAIEALAKNQNIQLLDVRTPQEFSAKQIENAINIDWKNQEIFQAQIKHLNKKEPIYVYCLSGGRSKEAASHLTSLGFEVYDIQGGIVKWEADNLPIIKKEVEKKEDEFSIQDFENAIKNNKIVLIDFYAPWCAPCRIVGPMVDNIGNKLRNVKVIKIDIDKSEKLYKSLGIQSIPTLFIYKNGQKTWSFNGVPEQNAIEKNL